MLRILIVDDHGIVREGLRQIISCAPDVDTIDDARSGEEALERIRANDYDVVLLDISMPGKSGMDTLREIRETKPGLPVLMLSMHPQEDYAGRALKEGAAGYITKSSAFDELIEAIRRVSAGEKYSNSAIMDGSSEGTPESVEAIRGALSDREYQVLVLIASGKRTGEIAEELSLSVKTVSTYKTHIITKLNLRNADEIADFAIKRGALS